MFLPNGYRGVWRFALTLEARSPPKRVVAARMDVAFGLFGRNAEVRNSVRRGRGQIFA
jgi:hypothetical protein